MVGLYGKKILKMIDRLVNRIFRWDSLRNAIFDEVHMYDEVDKRIKEYKDEEPTNLTWSEGDTWYGWTYSKSKNRYYFDDIGNVSLMGLWEDQWARESDEPYPSSNK
jgi:hypothetical protein